MLKMSGLESKGSNILSGNELSSLISEKSKSKMFDLLINHYTKLKEDEKLKNLIDEYHIWIKLPAPKVAEIFGSLISEDTLKLLSSVFDEKLFYEIMLEIIKDQGGCRKLANNFEYINPNSLYHIRLLYDIALSENSSALSTILEDPSKLHLTPIEKENFFSYLLHNSKIIKLSRGTIADNFDKFDIKDSEIRNSFIQFIIHENIKPIGIKGLTDSEMNYCLNEFKKRNSYKSVEDMQYFLGIGDVSQSKVLNLSGKNIVNLPTDLSLLEHIEELNLSYNPLSSFPSQLYQLKNLKKIDISGSFKDKEFPIEISKIQSLEEIKYTYNGCAEIPRGLSKLKSLKKLILSDNILNSIPNDFVNFNKLKTLDLSRNKFIKFPEIILGYNNLFELNLSWNKIENLSNHEVNYLQSIPQISIFSSTDESKKILDNKIKNTKYEALIKKTLDYLDIQIDSSKAIDDVIISLFSDPIFVHEFITKCDEGLISEPVCDKIRKKIIASDPDYRKKIIATFNIKSNKGGFFSDTIESDYESIIKTRGYNMSDPVKALQFLLGEGGGKLYSNPKTVLVDYYMTTQAMKAQGMLGEGGKYVVGPITSNSSRSYGYQNCTSIIVSATNTQGEKIGFVTHQDPFAWLKKNHEDFKRDFCNRFSDLKNQSIENTIDVVIAGGNYYDSKHREHGTNRQQYIKSVNGLKEIISKASNGKIISIPVLRGPALADSENQPIGTDIIFEPTSNLLLIGREEQLYNHGNQQFETSQSNKYLGVLDLHKKLLIKNNPEPFYKKLQQEFSENKKTNTIEGSDHTPQYEREIWNKLITNKISTWKKYKRTDENSRSADIDSNIGEYIGQNYLNQELQKRPLNQINNFQNLIKKATHDLLRLSNNGYKMTNPKGALAYYINKKTSSVKYMLGNSGYYFIEKSDLGKNALILQNCAIFLKSFYLFADLYLDPKVRGKYIGIIQNSLKDILEKELPSEVMNKVLNEF